MTRDELATKLRQAQAWVPERRIMLDFGDEGLLFIDGVNGDVRGGGGDADTRIVIAWSDWLKLASGDLDGVTAFMTGKLKIDGDMSNAMQLQGVLSKLRS